MGHISWGQWDIKGTMGYNGDKWDGDKWDGDKMANMTTFGLRTGCMLSNGK